MGQPYLVQASFRYRDDDGDETGATWRQLVNIDDSLDVDTNYRMRFLILNTGAKSADLIAQLEYNLAGAGWNPVTESSNVVRSVESGYYSDGAATSQQLGSGNFAAGEMDDADGTGGITGTITVAANGTDEETEVEYVFQILSGDVSNDQLLELRVTQNSEILDLYSETPSITVVKEATVYDETGKTQVVTITQVQAEQQTYLDYGHSQVVLIAQAESDGPTVVETVSQVITVPQASADLQTYNEPRSQVVTVAQASSDQQDYVEALSLAILIAQAEEDKQTYTETLTQVVLLSQNRTDSQGEIYDELGKSQTLVLVLGASDLQTYTEDHSQTVLVTVASADTQTYVESRSQVVLVVPDSTDTLEAGVVYDELGKSQTLVIAQASQDKQVYVETTTQVLEVAQGSEEYQTYLETLALVLLVQQARTDIIPIPPVIWRKEVSVSTDYASSVAMTTSLTKSFEVTPEA